MIDYLTGEGDWGNLRDNVGCSGAAIVAENRGGLGFRGLLPTKDLAKWAGYPTI